MTEEWVKNLIKTLENKECDLSTASNIENNNNTISIYNNLINTYGYIDDSDDCHTLFDKSLLNISDDLGSNTDYDNNLDTQINDDYHYYDHNLDQEQNENEQKGDNKKVWILVALGAVWSAIVYIFCCRCC